MSVSNHKHPQSIIILEALSMAKVLDNDLTLVSGEFAINRHLFHEIFA